MIRNFFNQMGMKLQRFMSGRYGSDELTLFLMIVSLLFFLLSYIRVLWFFYLIGVALLLWSMFRSMSRKIAKRQKERATFLRLTAKPRAVAALQKNKWRDRHTHRYFKCPHCHAVLRVPKNKGKIDVTCPRCKTITVKKT